MPTTSALEILRRLDAMQPLPLGRGYPGAEVGALKARAAAVLASLDAAPPVPLVALAWMASNEIDQSMERLDTLPAAECLSELADVRAVLAWLKSQGADMTYAEGRMLPCEVLESIEHAARVALAAEAAPKLRAILYDARGVEVETLEGPADEVAAKAARFMVLQGTDPDENGAAKAAGTVEFQPL